MKFKCHSLYLKIQQPIRNKVNKEKKEKKNKGNKENNKKKRMI